MPTKDPAKQPGGGQETKKQAEEDFEAPPQEPGSGAGQGTGPADADEEAAADGFTSPSDAAAAEAAAVDFQVQRDVDPRLLELRDAVAKGIGRHLALAAEAGGLAVQDLDGPANLQGVGISDAQPGSGGAPGEPVLTLYVAESMDQDEAKAVVVDGMGVSAASGDDVPVNVVVSSVFDAFTHRARYRPAPAGVSIGHCKVTAGTLGGWTRGRPGTPRYNRLLLLSNNHVVANSNNARYGDFIIQPGAYDGGKCTVADRIAILERFVTIQFGGQCNYVDAGTGWCWPNLVRRDYVYRSGSGHTYFRVSNVPSVAARGWWVGKTGRTTQLTRGAVVDTNWTGKVNYGGGRVALFCDQMVIQTPGGQFSAGGDSGSLIWTWDSRRSPVGLLFAGGGGLTIANKIHRVTGALDLVFANL